MLKDSPWMWFDISDDVQILLNDRIFITVFADLEIQLTLAIGNTVDSCDLMQLIF